MRAIDTLPVSQLAEEKNLKFLQCEFESHRGDQIDIRDILKLYPEYDKVYGPYNRSDGRKHIILRITGYKNSPTKTISYPKALLEIKLGRILEDNETADHEDENFTNNNINNLQQLSRADNSAKAMSVSNRKEKIEICVCLWCNSKFERPLRYIKRRQTILGMAGPFCNRICARKYQTDYQTNG